MYQARRSYEPDYVPPLPPPPSLTGPYIQAVDDPRTIEEQLRDDKRNELLDKLEQGRFLRPSEEEWLSGVAESLNRKRHEYGKFVAGAVNTNCR